MFSSSSITIDKSALKNNLAFIREQVKNNDTKISSVVKGNAYGHGIEIFVPLAEQCGMDHFSVYSADEALRISNVTTGESTIMIMGYVDNEELDWAVENDIEFFVFELDRLEKSLKSAVRHGKKAKIHLELETGMNRTGFERWEYEEVTELLKKYAGNYELKGMCTHFAGSENIANYVRVQKQRENFNEACEWFAKNDIKPELKHVACSAALVRYPDTQMDMVRTGILQYGFWPSQETKIAYLANKQDKRDPLKQMISWKSKVMSIKHVGEGQFIGYGTTYLAHRDMKVAIIPVGYAHGFTRSLSNTGRVLINGDRLGVVSIVNMNALAVDVTNCKQEVKKGDEAVLIGSQGDHILSVSSFGELSDQLNYELLTRLPLDIPRKVTS